MSCRCGRPKAQGTIGRLPAVFLRGQSLQPFLEVRRLNSSRRCRGPRGVPLGKIGLEFLFCPANRGRYGNRFDGEPLCPGERSKLSPGFQVQRAYLSWHQITCHVVFLPGPTLRNVVPSVVSAPTSRPWRTVSCSASEPWWLPGR